MTRTKLSVVLIAVCVVKCLAMTYDELEDFAEYLQKTSKLSPTLKKGVDPDDDYDEEEVVSDHAWEDSGKFEGDLILNERQRRFIVEDVAEGLARNGISDGTKRWPNNEVVYYIQVEHFNSGQVQAIQSGIEDLARASCVKFRPYKKGDRDAVVIQGSRRGCFSQVGYQGGYQVLNLSGRHPVGRGCFRHGTVVHELLHTLGFYHMQSSPDRDDYVDIVWANIVQSARHNFRKYNSFAVSDFGVGYDYDSVLHYSRRAFSTNGQDTIVPKQSGAQIGQRVGLSDKDTQKLNKMYCDADSNLFQSEENASKKTDTKKKNAKNKPFDGQGIGYHQGKAVAFKLLPTAETYKLPDVPSFHVFDYFSKEPQLLSTAENEGFRIGKEMTYSYNPPEHLAIHEDKRLHDFDTHPETKPDHTDMKLHAHAHDHDHIAEMKHVFSQAKKQLSKPHSAVELPKHDSYAGSVGEEKLDPYLVDTFDRLSKIIKMHVYPSQTPDLSAYKMNEHFINYYSPSQDKPTETIVSSNPIKTVVMEEDMMHPNNRKHNYKFSEFSLDKHLTDSPVNWNKEKYEQNQEHIQNAPVAVTSNNSNYKKYNSFPLNKHFEDKYLTETSFQSPGNYRDKEKLTSVYYPKIHKDDKRNENHDEWHQKYVPHYPDHDYYHTKDSSRKPEYDSKSSEYIFSSSNPSRFQEFSDFHNPTKMMKHWNKIKDTSIENR